MEQYKVSNIDYDYAVAWSLRQGEFSFNLSKNLVNYFNKNGIKVNNCLDICCGTGEFLNTMKKVGAKCTGTEVAQSMIDYNKQKYEDMTFVHTDTLADFKFKEKFDLISCNHDMVNSLETFAEWEKLFKTVKSHLAKDGVFVFDYYTKNKLENWDETIYEQSNDIDYVKQVKPKLGKSVIQETYYIKKTPEYYHKSTDILVESYYENEQVLESLKKIGFKDIKVLNYSLEPITSLPRANRIHIIAK